MQSILMETTLDYDSFINTVHLIMKERMGAGYDVQIYKVMKNNSLELHSLVVRRDEESIAPNIYLKPYYEAYLQGVTLDEIIDRLCMIYDSCSSPEQNQSISYTLQEMKSYICYRLVSYEKNRKLLKTVPYFRYLDLAVTFHCLVRDDEEGIGTIRITNEHVKLWGITTEELKELANSNTKRLFPATIRSMEEVLLGMLKGRVDSEAEDRKDSALDGGPGGRESRPKPMMYVLSNQKGINGATCLLYPEVIRSFAEELKADLYILPSSIHEIILIPADQRMKVEALNRMVEEVNRTQVAEEEVLSDHVYYYSREKDMIFI